MDKERAKVFNIKPRYEFIKNLGQGTYGAVILAYDLQQNKQKVAIKKLHLLQDLIDAKRILREIRILRSLKHENILELYNIIYDDSSNDQEFGDIYLVTNYMEIDLYKVIKSKQELTDDHIQYIMYQIIRGVYYMHSANIIHRDLKPSNILANENCDVRMCDFGLARIIDDEQDEELTEYVVTRYYRAPEIMLSSHDYNKPVDIWSIGCTFAELITKKILFPTSNYIQQIKLIFETLGKPNLDELKFISNQNAKKFINQLPDTPYPQSTTNFIEYENKLVNDLLDKMLVIDPQKRITAEEALKHPYFENLHDPEDEPQFIGTIDFSFELDPEISLEDIRYLILEEINYFKKLNKEALINVKKALELSKKRTKMLNEKQKPQNN